jgi:hypothetical protein
MFTSKAPMIASRTRPTSAGLLAETSSVEVDVVVLLY